MATGTIVDVVMPQMGVSVSEGTITRWLRNVGDTVAADESLLEISTDKVDTEVPSPGSGVLQEILVQEGETVAVGTLLARIGAAGSAPAPEEPAAPAEPEPIAEDPVPARPPRPARSPWWRSASPRLPESPHLRPRATAPRRETGIASCRRSWRGSQQSTTSTPQRSQAPAATAASRRRTSLPLSSRARPGLLRLPSGCTAYSGCTVGATRDGSARTSSRPARRHPRRARSPPSSPASRSSR